MHECLQALTVIHLAGVPTELEFGDVPMKMLFADVVGAMPILDAAYKGLKDAEAEIKDIDEAEAVELVHSLYNL